VLCSLMASSLPFLPPAFAESDICNKARNATCENIGEISDNLEQIEKECGKDVLRVFEDKIRSCQEEAEKEKREKEEQLRNIESRENAAERALRNINWSIRKLNAEIASLNLSISQLDSAIKEREKAIEELSKALQHQKEVLAETVRQLFEYDSTCYIKVFLGYGSISDFGQRLMEMERLQMNLESTIKEIQEAKEKMEKEKADLEKDKEKKLRYKRMQEFSRQNLVLKQKQQKYLLERLAEAKTPLEREMARIEAELMELRNAMSRIQRYLASWLISPEIPSWSEIFSAVSFASERSGASVFLILGTLQVESTFRLSAGNNMGSPEANLQRCLDNRIDDSLCYQQKPVFEEICAELHLDPNKVPISYAYAMGPAQFIPTTWRAYQKKDPAIKNPWRLNDAVLAMAYKLGGGDWKTAAYHYNPGGGKCSSNPCGTLSTYCDKVVCSAYRWKEVYRSCGGFDLTCSDLRSRLERMGIPAE